MTGTGALPGFYNDIDLSLAAIKSLLLGGAQDRHAAAHHPVVASIGRDGRPRQRVMILRDFDWDQRLLRFHTDGRSEKVSEIQQAEWVSALVYGELGKIQVRLSGRAWIDTGHIAEQAWQGSSRFARRCYMAEQAPGTDADRPTSGLPEWIEGLQPLDEQLIPARENFAALLICFDEIDFLYLANAGHRRARWKWNGSSANWSGRWLVP
ncbi:MAG: pyridoxamine 5'-phosphate oxidase family protein [Sphingomonadaceae bacterium]|nr:pyridoxamine 5'-phosphate oxidase family protein [Sphingomonadaceae bacterium]